MLLDNLTVVMFRPKYPENVGSAARACLNMGCNSLTLVAPRDWDIERALPLSTVHAADLVRGARIVDTLEEALAGYSYVYGTTARTGGWRKGIVPPDKAAADMVARTRQGGSVAVVFGPEDRGLTNDETKVCSSLVTIPTAPECSSLNLSQAVLVILYECLKAAYETPFTPAGPPKARATTFEENETLFKTIQDSLLAIDFLKDDNPDYWMLPVRRFMQRIRLHRNEFNLLMGICRQIQWIAAKAKGK